MIHPFPPRQLAYEYQYTVFAVYAEYQLHQYDDKDMAELERRMDEHAEFFIERILPKEDGKDADKQQAHKRL
ncbi:hypothetical protein [Paenibacillus sp. NPDC057967]|uniref:hypothetical protein n=1 Tax=Paenibacillus sp. NPDC057967 TaxID=3346293 RepID=UPI0036DDF5DF